MASQREISEAIFTVNGRNYRPPRRPIAVVCIDGCGDEYLDAAISRGAMPNLTKIAATGYRGMARAAIPTFTNVNNASIVTGVAPNVTGISGNFFLDPRSGQEVMMNSAEYLRCPTILAAAAQAGRKVAMVTAKEKLRDILSKDLKGIAFSAEKADEAQGETHGIERVIELTGQPKPAIYSGDASLFVLRAGVALLRQEMADFLYLSLTDYIQHKHPPEDSAALIFYAGIDYELGQLLSLGAIVAVTADHGMNGKNLPDGTPRVIYLESELVQVFGHGIKVICPITDPYVVHHGALGSLVMVHLAEPGRAAEIAAYVLKIAGVTEVYDRETAALKLELPADRIGDLTVMVGRDVAIGRTPDQHDLSVLVGGLRSHGGRYEEMVPLLISEPLTEEYYRKAQGDPRNFDIFDFACNGVEV